MNDKFYKQLIEDSPTGYAYHKIICDVDGVPYDYEFIDVNKAFAKILGLKLSDIVGKKISNILPQLNKSECDFIHIYGDIAINGGEKEVEQFSESLKCFYKVLIRSPEKYYFTTHFIDITKQMSQLSELKSLIGISEEFLQIDDKKINYQEITDNLLKICGAKYAVFNLFEEDGRIFTTEALSGSKLLFENIPRLIRSNIEGKEWNHDPIIDEKIKNSTITRFYSLRELVENIIPIQLLLLIEKMFSMGEVILITISKNNIMLGNFILIMEIGERFNKDTLAEVYTRQLGLVISRMRAESKLLNERILTDAIFNSVQGMIYLYDDKSRLVRWNKKHEDITGYSTRELYKMNLMDWFKGDEESQKAIENVINRATREGFGDAEAVLQRKDGTTVLMYFTASVLYLDGKQYFAGISIDIEERKKKEDQIYYLSYHDQLTGLYNRRFYEEELKRLDVVRNLPMTIVMGDVNGLKLINDSFGHVMGDELLIKVAKVIKQGCRDDDIVARLGGDEFVIILPKTDMVEAEKIVKRIADLSSREKIGFVDISISFGCQTKNYENEEIEEIFKNAEDHMYKKKLVESPNMRGKTIEVIINTLHEKNKREERHAHRVSELCRKMGEVLGMLEYENNELKSIGLLHDIGKVAIDEGVLNKIDKLTDDEWKEIKSHPEIGYRMLNTVTNMSTTASCVLYHHERWDGKGYPKGLKGNAIPLMSRIITIADSYDAMTSDRCYKSAMPKEAAINELQNNAGTQFDPELVSIFIEKVLEVHVDYY